MRQLRILRNQEGGSPGGGQQQQPPSPAQPPPQANQAAPLTREDLAAFGKDLAKQVHDGVFAELRRSGTLSDKPKAKPANGAKPSGENNDETTAIAAPALDSARGRALDRAVGKVGIAAKLTERQYASLERDYVTDNPQDTEAWVKQWASDFGIATEQPKPAETSTAGKTAAGTQQQTQNPVTARGAPAATSANVEELNLWTCSQADRDAFIAQKGAAAYMAKLREQGKGVKVKTRE